MTDLKVVLQFIATGLAGLVVFGLLVFWPAGTFDHWQGWAFIAVFAAATNLPSIYLLAGNVVLMVGIPLALGSFWGLVFVIPGLFVLAARISDEEKVLTVELAGYTEYTQQVHYRLLPYVW